MIIQALDKLNFVTAMRFEDILVFLTDFNYRFQAIGCKGWRKHQYLFHSLTCTFLHNFVGKRLEPFFVQA